MADPGAKALKEIVDGLDGVTEGPWKVYNGCSWSRIGRVGGRDTAVVYPYISPSDGHPEMGSSEGYHVRNFDHIARCDPDKMRSIAAYVAKLEAEVERLRSASDLTKCTARDCRLSEYCARHAPAGVDYSSPIDSGECPYFQKLRD